MGDIERPAVGHITVRDLLARLAARGEAMPVAHAIVIVAGAASRAHAESDNGRLDVTCETVVVGFDGTIDVRGAISPRTGDYHDDVIALGRLLAELLARPIDAPKVPSAVTDVVSAALDSDPECSFATTVGLASALAEAARIAGIALSRRELGRWSRRVVHPPKYAHTLRKEERATARLAMEDLLDLGVSPAALGLEPPPLAVALDDDFDDDDIPDTDVFEGLPLPLPLPAPPELVPAPAPLPLAPPSLLAMTPPARQITTAKIRSLRARARRGASAVLSAAAIVAFVVLASGATGHAVSNRAAPAMAAAPVAVEPAIETIVAPVRDASTASEAVADCERRRRTSSRRVRVACAITACKNARPDLHAAFVEPLSRERRAVVARACQAAAAAASTGRRM